MDTDVDNIEIKMKVNEFILCLSLYKIHVHLTIMKPSYWSKLLFKRNYDLFAFYFQIFW